MNFFIKKNATLPIMKLDVIQDGRNDMSKIYEMIQNSNIYFSMTEVETGKKIIGNKSALILPKESSCNGDEYYIGYKFSENETKKPGTYIGEFTIEFLDGSGKLIVPIREELHIQIIDGTIKK
jgi:hypothetical protein